MLKWIWLSVVVVILDLATKAIASDQLILHQPVAMFPGFNFTLMHNSGAAFSFLSDASGWQRWFFTIVALGVSVGIVVWLKGLARNQRWTAVALALILGGALGNVWDRITLGYVVDFIQVYYDRWYWPAFNIADSAISVGAVTLIIDAFRTAQDEKKQASEKV
ncbi:MAG: lipoprotein signal peptidase [Gammaproteobacteria bacterium]|nr:lipoprotein signal peptidase [Gammaproteobacteria bacterium]